MWWWLRTLANVNQSVNKSVKEGRIVGAFLPAAEINQPTTAATFTPPVSPVRSGLDSLTECKLT